MLVRELMRRYGVANEVIKYHLKKKGVLPNGRKQVGGILAYTYDEQEAITALDTVSFATRNNYRETNEGVLDNRGIYNLLRTGGFNYV